MIIKTGIIGISSGNGHPYSWSAIVNGYDKIEMKKCRFKVIPNYLMLYKNTPLNKNIVISHIWTQNFKESAKIAKASKIPYITFFLCSSFTNRLDSLALITSRHIPVADSNGEDISA